MKKEIVCPVCGGRGHVSWINSTETSCYSGSKTCPNCNGTRWVEVDLTNADHIRHMTDEELAKFLLEIMSNSVCFGEGMFPYHPCPQDQDCEKCGLGWLKQPYKEAK